MKLRKSFNAARFKSGIKQIGGEFSPLLAKPYLRGKNFLEARPYKTLMWMFGIALSNFFLWMYIAHKHPVKDFSISDMPFNKVRKQLVVHDADVPFTISNFMAISKMKDSLDYLMAKKHLTKEDTLLFVRIAQQYERIDPNFFHRITNIKKQP